MVESINKFFLGIRDSLRVLNAFRDTLTNSLILQRTLQITAINGGIYLGSVFLYNIFISTFFIESDSLIFFLIKFITNVFYTIWLFIVYLISLTLSTYWVQDIFDEAVPIKI